MIAHGAQPEARVIFWLRQACDSLAEAHAQGLVHRDLKPQILSVCRQGIRHDVVKVLDFGLAKRNPIHIPDSTPGSDGEVQSSQPAHPRLTGIGQVAGTPGFMAPEQALGAAADQRSDLYAMVCVVLVAHWHAGLPV